MSQRGKLLKNCKQCGTEFNVQPYRMETALYCSRSCKSTAIYPISLATATHDHKKGNNWRAGLPPTNAFLSGNHPWNKDLKGIHLSPNSEFKKGTEWANVSDPLGTEKPRTSKENVTRWFVKTAQPDQWELRARVVWEKHNGPIPKGKLIHHDDRDTENDDIGNLRCLTRAEHMKEHRDEIRAITAEAA